MFLRVANFFMFAFVFMFCGAALAQIAEVTIPAVSNTDFLIALGDSIGGMKGGSAVVIAGIVTQLLMKFIGTPWAEAMFGKDAGPWKFTIAAVLSFATGILGLVTSGLTVGAALIHSTTLFAFMVMVNQIYKQFFEKK